MERLRIGVEKVQEGDGLVTDDVTPLWVRQKRHSLHYGESYTTLLFSAPSGLPGQVTFQTYVPNGTQVEVLRG